MQNRYTLPLLSALVVAASLASCQRGEEDSPASAGREIGFAVCGRDEAGTKAAPLTTEYFSTSHNDFKALAYTHADNAAVSAWSLYPDSDRLPLTLSYSSSSGLWLPTDGPLPWPGTGDKITFIAYAPATLPDPTTSAGEALADGQAPFLCDFTQSTAVADQKDILLAKATCGASPLADALNVNLSFTHALTPVKFSIGESTTCSSITLSGIPGTGTLDMNSGSWSSVGTPATYTISSPTFGSADASQQCPIDEEFTLMLIPQTLPSGATLTAETSAGTVTASLAGQVWEPGKEVTYRLTEPPVPSFSVSESQTVKFSPGNLQYQASSGTWRFAEHQYDYVGNSLIGNVYAGETKSDNGSIGDSYDGWIDLFGWGTSGQSFESGYGSAYQPWSASSTDTDYGPTDGTSGLTDAYAAGDWGVNMGSGWRTLTPAEWTYLLDTRTGDRYCKATVNSVSGLVIFPDGYSHPSGVTAPAGVNTEDAAYTSNTWSEADWTKMEAAGCVFLPAAGGRGGTAVSSVNSSGYYWSSTPKGTNRAYSLSFSSGSVLPATSDSRHYGNSVRLVQNL